MKLWTGRATLAQIATGQAGPGRAGPSQKDYGLGRAGLSNLKNKRAGPCKARAGPGRAEPGQDI